MKAIGAILFASLFSAPVHAAKVPKADFNLKLDQYSIELSSYPFPSGLTVIFQEEHSQPVVAVTSVIDSGSSNDQPGMEGIAHVVEHLMFRAQHGDLPKVMDLGKQLGGAFNASTSEDWTNYMTIAPRDALEPLLAVEARRLKDGLANVTEEHVKLEVEIARNEKRMRDENAAIGDAFRVAGQLLYPEGHPYTRSTIGSHDSLSAITLAGAQEYVAKHYIPENTTLVVVGDFKLSEGFGLLMKAWEQDLDLLMAPKDAAKYNALTSEADRKAFLDTWVASLGEYISKTNQTAGAKRRVACEGREDPPMPVSQEPMRIKGQVKKETVVLIWSAPGAYCGEDVIARQAAAQLSNYIYQTLVPSWDYQNDDLEGLGCFTNGQKYATAVYCFIEPSSSYKQRGERLAEKAADALYMQWDREVYKSEIFRGFMEWVFQRGKIAGMTGALNNVDEVAALYGRATITAMDAHFTGDVRYFSRNMQAMQSLTGMYPVQEYARKWLTRDRMATIIVEPMDKEERQRMEASARTGQSTTGPQYEGASRDDALSTLFTMEDMKGGNLKAQVISPDLEKGRSFKLDNGLEVVMLPHGEAPLVRARLFMGGDVNTSKPEGLAYFAGALHERGTKIPPTEQMMAVAGDYGERPAGYGRYLGASAASGNLDAVLSRLRKKTGEVDYTMAKKREWINDRVDRSKGPKYSGDPDAWGSRLTDVHLWGDHPYGEWGERQYWERMRDWDQSMVEQWVNRFYQPANATLFIVGKIPDLDAAEQTVRDYFGSWVAEPGTEVGPIAPPEAPTQLSERKVLVFDKPTSTQMNVSLACPMKPWTNETYLAGRVLGDSISEVAWRRLREKAGVTYGAYAFNETYPGGASALKIGGLFQNDATEFAVGTYLDMINEASVGDIDPSIVATAKWSRARETVLAQQSSRQMIGYLAGTVASGRGLDYLKNVPQYLDDVDTKGMADLMSTCKGHEMIALMGPLEYAEPALKKLGLPYEVVDWDELHQAQLTEKELKKHFKAKEKWEQKKAEEALEKAAESKDG